MVFLPREAESARQCEEAFEAIAREEGQRVLGWRTVPTDDATIGLTARASRPLVRQIFIERSRELADDLAFLRRVTLDTVGVVPSEAEIADFKAQPAAKRRSQAIDRLLADPRWADGWMGYWLDVLAENPNLINPTLNNTGPFRWWIYESLLDNKPLYLFVTELIRMEGSERFGGPAGFGTASQNDVPAAAKGVILSSALIWSRHRSKRSPPVSTDDTAP